MNHERPISEALFKRSKLVIPGGVNSPVRAFQAVGGTPFFVDHASGAYITDVDGTSYIDYVQSWGASILGHANPYVVEAVQRAAEKGTTYGAPTESELALAEEITRAVDGVDMVRFVSSGTEAAMTAIRLARGTTGRDRIVKFAGCYHGHSDALLAGGGSGIATLGLPDSCGVTRSAVADTLVVAYNTIPELDDNVACVIVEPVAANMGLVAPAPGFLEGLRAACDRAGALLIFDEVITGFRLRRGSVADLVGVRADLYCFGKVIGGGLPLAALGGSTGIMSELAPTGPVYQAGTLSGNPLATAAGLATLLQLDDSAYQSLTAKVSQLASGLGEAFASHGISALVPTWGTLLGIVFTDREVANYDDAKRASAGDDYRRFFHAMAERNIAIAPSPYEVGFCSLAHGNNEIEITIAACCEAAKVLAS